MVQRETNAPEAKTVLLIGAGLVGSLAAVYFAEAGWNVHLYEQRCDLRQEKYSQVRSINLAVSHRGIRALRGTSTIDVNALLGSTMPMKGRMIHPVAPPHDVNACIPQSQLYGLNGETLQSMDRRKLNEQLLNAADRLPNVTTHFEHELKDLDVVTGHATFHDRQTNKNFNVRGDLVVGCDGAHSAVRSHMLRPARMNFSQRYIDHCYLELNMPAVATGPFVPWAIDPGHLHIWPRHEFMLIALPNLDGSFTCTLFAPWHLMDSVKTPHDVQRLFSREFADAMPFMPDLLQEFFDNPKGPLITIECSPHYFGKTVLLGDSAHAMVPFYGQGLNCGFEDIITLFEFMRQACVSSTRTPSQVDNGPNPKLAPEASNSQGDVALCRALTLYAAAREKDAFAICQLAQVNYDEMRSDVITFRYRARRMVSRILSQLLPFEWLTPQYSLVAFSHTPYSECARRGKRMTFIADALINGSALAGAAIVIGVAMRARGVAAHKPPTPAIKPLMDMTLGSVLHSVHTLKRLVFGQ